MDAIVDLIEWLIKTPFLCCGWIIIGTAAGALARRATGAANKPLLSDLLLGLGGAVVGGFVAGSLLGIDTNDTGGITYWLITLVVATGGAMLLVYIGRAIRGNKSKGRKKK